MKNLVEFLDYIANHPGIMALTLACCAAIIYRKYTFKQLYLDIERGIHRNIRHHNEVTEDIEKKAKKALKQFEHLSEGKILFCELMYLRYYFEEEWHLTEDASLWIPNQKEYPHRYNGKPIIFERHGYRVTIKDHKKIVDYINKPQYALYALSKLRRELVHFSIIFTIKSIYWYYLDRDFKIFNNIKYRLKIHS